MADTNYKETIDVFYGGISDDIRIQKPEVFSIAQHFDIWTNPKRLTPYRSMEADETTSFKITNFAYDSYTLFGAGRKSGGTKVKLYQKTTLDSIASSWAACTTGEDSADNAIANAGFLIYHGYIFGGKLGGIYAWGQVVDPSPTFTSAAYGSQGIFAQGIITSDDLLIFPAISDLYVKDGFGAGVTANWSTPLSLPTNRQISDLTEFGAYVAIAVHPGGGYNGQLGSKVHLWDKVSPDITQTIDWGEGHLLILENMEGTLIGVSQVGFGEEGIIKQKLVVRQYVGGNEAQVLFEIESDDTTLTVRPNYTKVRDGNRILFGLQIKKDGTTYYQMASIGRKSAAYPWAFTLDRLVDNATAVTSIDGAFKLGQTIFIAHNADGSVNRTNDTADYPTATYISQRRDGSDRIAGAKGMKKQLLMGGLSVVPLTTGQTASLYYRTDSNLSWTLIHTYSYGDDTTNNEVPINMGFESGKQNDDTDFVNYKELQFKVLSTAGAEVTGINYTWKLAGGSISQG